MAVLHSINISDGGVPKHPVLQARITAAGVEGDRQRDRRHHGGPLRAVSLYSLDLIEALGREGHPIAPGTAGENLTIAGIDWRAMQPGAQVQVGEVQLVLTAFASPCRNIAGSFAGEAIERIGQKRHPGWSRVYARVIREGMLSVGVVVHLMNP
jgi:MOSC domain-containing protein YiiM